MHELVVAEHPERAANTDFRRDMLNVAVGIVWQTALTASGIYIVIGQYSSLVWALATVALATLFLKFNWLDKLQDYPADLAGVESESPDLD